MKTNNGMSLHNIVSVEIKSNQHKLDNGEDFTVDKYVFIDADGNRFTVNAFMEVKKCKRSR